MKTVAIINDFTTCEEIALGVQMPILRAMGHKVLPIPSKILDYPLCVDGAVELETVEFAKSMFASITNRNDKIDAVLSGFIPSVDLASKTKEFCEAQKSRGALIFVDPVFGDNGKAYKSVKPENIEAQKELLKVADYCFPNYTEACLLTGVEYKGITSGDSAGFSYENGEYGMTSSEARNLLIKLKAFGVKIPIVTGCIVEGRDAIAYLSEGNELAIVEYERINGHLPGTGDRFAAGVVGRLGNDESLLEAISKTAIEISNGINRIYMPKEMNQQSDGVIG